MPNVYNRPPYPNPNIRPNNLLKLSCTTQLHFYDHYVNIYTQNDGIAMGSTLGPTLSAFYICQLEN